MFDEYRQRLGYYGQNNREALQGQSVKNNEAVFKDSPLYISVAVNSQQYDAHLIKDKNDTVDSGNGNYKLEFRDGVNFIPGTYVFIYNNKTNQNDCWMIIDNLDNFNFHMHLVKKCNYLLKWKNKNNTIVQRWCIFDTDSTLGDGIRTYQNNTKLPDGNLNALLPLDTETAQLKRDQRFLIDSPLCEGIPDSYTITNRDAVTRCENNGGVISLALSLGQFNPITDNTELMVADYTISNEVESPTTPVADSYIEIVHSGSAKITMGSPFKNFTAKYYNNGAIDNSVVCSWNTLVLSDFVDTISAQADGNILKIKCPYDENLINYTFKIVATYEDVSQELMVKVVSGI